VTEVLPPLRVLLVEDSATDAKLVLQALRGLGRPIEHERVDDAGSMRALLEERPWDVVLSDWSMLWVPSCSTPVRATSRRPSRRARRLRE